jgi:hypothetical protein
MNLKILILFNFVLFNSITSAQCPDLDSLWKRLIFLRDAYQIPNNKKLNELLTYEKEMRPCTPGNDSTTVLLNQRIGMAYFGLSDYLKAIKYLKESIRIGNIKRTNNRYNIWNYFYLSAAYDSLHNTPEKMNAVDSCISVAMKLNAGSDIACLYSLYTKIEYYYDIGDYYTCQEYAKTCEKYALQYAQNDNERGKSFASSSLGWNVEALLRLKDFKSAENLLTNKLAEYKKTGLQKYLGVTYDQLAHVQISKGNYMQALHLLKLALFHNEKANYIFNCKQIKSTIGYEIYFKHLNDYDQALSCYRSALKYINKDKTFELKDSIESLNIYNRIGNAFVKKGNFDSAFKYFQKGFDQVQQSGNEMTIMSAAQSKFRIYKKINYLSSLIIDKGDAFKDLYFSSGSINALKQAIKVYKAADVFLDSIKADLSDLQSKLFWRIDSRRLYENAIEACYLANNIADAFYFFEKSKAVLLNDQLLEQRWLAEKEIMQLTQLKKKIFRLQSELINTAANSKNYSDLQNDLFNSKRELGGLQEFIKANNPLYYQNFVDKKFITTEDVQKNLLTNHNAFVEIFSGDSAVYSLIITPSSCYFNKINKIYFDSLSTLYEHFISDPKSLNLKFGEYVKVASQLYQLLFQKVKLPPGRMIISPDGKYFPFEGLVTNVSSRTWFLETYAVSYAYSARYLVSTITSTEPGKSFMGVAPVKFPGLPDLNGSEQSLLILKKYFSQYTNYIGTNATKKNFLDEFYKYKVVQLYTHASDSGYRGEPVIYFSDSVLSLSDLLPEKRPVSNLVVLSACQTASGRLYSGEGVFSFNRSFAALGISSTVSNLWQVNDQATYQLTELFYKYVVDGLPLDIALQKAKTEFIRKNKHTEYELPFYWASSILIGKTDVISIQKKFEWKWVVVLIIILVFLIACVIYFNRKPKVYKTGFKKYSFKV